MIKKIDELMPDPSNAMTHKEKNIEAIKGSLKRFGQQKPIVVDKQGVVIAGNGTLLAAKVLGWKEIDVYVSELEGSDKTAYAIADNRTSEMATWDDDVLKRTMAELRNDGSLDETATGFTAEEIDKMMEDVEEDEPEVDFTRELLEKSNYVVFVFDNELDWNVIEEKFKIKPVGSLKSRKGFEQTGIGRVIDGKKLLEILEFGN